MKVFLTGGRVSSVDRSSHCSSPVATTSRRCAGVTTRRSGLQGLGAEPVTVDLFDPEAVERAVGGSEVVLHLATNVPTLTKAAWLKGWDTHNKLRVDATRHLVAAARSAGRAAIREGVDHVRVSGCR